MSSSEIPPFPVALDAEILRAERTILKKVSLGPVGPNDPAVMHLQALQALRDKFYSDVVAKADKRPAPMLVPKRVLLERNFTPAEHIVSPIPGLTITRLPGRKQSPERQRALAAARTFLLEKS